MSRNFNDPFTTYPSDVDSPATFAYNIEPKDFPDGILGTSIRALYVGQTGNSNGPHLHFEIWKNNHILDPRDFIKEYKLKDVSIEEYK